MQHESSGRLIDFVPAVYRRSDKLEAFLSAFESTLFGSPRDGNGEHRLSAADVCRQARSLSLDRQIQRIPSLLDADEACDEFLPWLAQWAAITLYWEAKDRRRLIAEMIPLYRIRGTKAYVERVLGLYVSGSVTVEEDDLQGIAVGVPERSKVGVDTRLGEDPFRFSVRIDFSTIPPAREERQKLVVLVRKVIDVAKPAYTHYRLTHNLPAEEFGLVINVRSTVGIDTVLYRTA